MNDTIQPEKMAGGAKANGETTAVKKVARKIVAKK
jgi:hypothetical protein